MALKILVYYDKTVPYNTQLFSALGDLLRIYSNRVRYRKYVLDCIKDAFEIDFDGSYSSSNLSISVRDDDVKILFSVAYTNNVIKFVEMVGRRFPIMVDKSDLNGILKSRISSIEYMSKR